MVSACSLWKVDSSLPVMVGRATKNKNRSDGCNKMWLRPKGTGEPTKAIEKFCLDALLTNLIELEVLTQAARSLDLY